MLFRMNALSSWHAVAVGDVLGFEASASGARSVSFEVMASDHVAVYAAEDGFEPVLVGCGHGQFECRYTVAGASVVTISSAVKDAQVFICIRTEPQLITESGETSFTTLAPRRVGPPDEVQQMMRLMKLNADRREAAIMREMRDLRAALSEREPVLVEPVAPAPAPAPEAGGAGEV